MSKSWPDNWPLYAIATIEEGEEEIERLQKRIEELEKERKQLSENPSELAQDLWAVLWEAAENAGVHLITFAQIDAANKVAQKCWENPHHDDGFLILENFGIERCKGCGGERKESLSVLYPTRKPCPDCDGHGWVMREADDE